MEPRWRVGRTLGRALYFHGQCVGMVDTPELAEAIVAAMNGVALNDREGIALMLSREANRIFRTQEQDYPSNVLDRVVNNLNAGRVENLSDDPFSLPTPPKGTDGR